MHHDIMFEFVFWEVIFNPSKITNVHLYYIPILFQTKIYEIKTARILVSIIAVSMLLFIVFSVYHMELLNDFSYPICTNTIV